MLRTSLFIALAIIVVSAAPSPYHHVIETPTSRVEQRLVFSPRMQESYQVKKEDVAPFSSFQLPKQQVVYYYEHPQQGQLPVQLYGARQDTPWWQDLWTQIMGQAQGQGEGEGGGESPAEETNESSELESLLESNKIAEPLNDLLPPLNEPTEQKHDSIKEETVEIVSTTQSPQEYSQENVIADDLESVRIDAAFRTASKQESENYSAEITTSKVDSTSVKDFTEKVETTSTAVSTTTLKLNEESPTTSSPLKNDEIIYKSSQEFEEDSKRFEKHDQESDNIVHVNLCRNGKEVSSAMHHIYSIDNQYYVVSGSPKFYGNAEARSLMFSLQELQPVMRNDDYVDDNAKLQDVASLTMTLQETTPAFMINVVDEDEEAKKSDDNNKQEQISARSKSPSDDQSLIVSDREEKRKESSAEGEST